MTRRGIPTTVLVAPDSFKGTFGSVEVADTVGRGLDDGGWFVDLCPVADGGEGTLGALMSSLGGEIERVTVADPLDRPVEAAFGIAGQTGVVEMATASGLGLIAASQRNAVAASSYGTGELIAHAIDAGAAEVLIGAGGSATTDGGAGALRALEERGGTGRARLIVLCDVRTPFEDAARVFGPQKGADADAVRRLTRRLNALARGWKRDPRGVPMTGAAGGLAGGLWARFGAELVPGASYVLDALGFNGRMRAARAVVTGEGCLDMQSLAGKAISEVATRARQAGVPAHAVVGHSELDSFGLRVLDLQAVIEARDLGALRRAGRELAKLL